MLGSAPVGWGYLGSFTAVEGWGLLCVSSAWVPMEATTPHYSALLRMLKPGVGIGTELP